MLVLAAILVGLTLAQAPAAPTSGSVTVNGTATPLPFSVLTTRKNAFNDFFNDPVVVLSNQALSEADAADDATLLARAQQSGLVTVAVRFDGRPRRGQLFNVAINHPTLAETTLLPDLWFTYGVKDGTATLTLDTRELAGRRYAADLRFPAPAAAEAAAPDTPSFELPPPSTTDADRQRASQLLIQALQDGDEARALAIIALGIDPNARDEKLQIALINWAVLMCQPPVVARLVELKADLTHERLPGMTLLAEARAACPEAVGYLRAGGAK